MFALKVTVLKKSYYIQKIIILNKNDYIKKK